MKRYLVMGHDFDSRALVFDDLLVASTPEGKAMALRNVTNTIAGIAADVGLGRLDQKVVDFKELGAAPFSLVAFHNKFFRQSRAAFCQGVYYPALTGACALAERIFNHLILALRDDFKATPEYKKVYNKNSFDNWDIAIDTLETWGVLLPKAAEQFRDLRDIRNAAIHFRPETDSNERQLALDALKKLSDVLNTQFGSFGTQPWYIAGTSGACFVRREAEQLPFVRKVVIPNCVSVGYKYGLEYSPKGWIVHDTQYPDKEITDEEFKDLFQNRKPEEVVTATK